jgi:hypothetical protein
MDRMARAGIPPPRREEERYGLLEGRTQKATKLSARIAARGMSM